MPQVNEFSWFHLNLFLSLIFMLVLFMSSYLMSKSLNVTISMLPLFKFKYFF